MPAGNPLPIPFPPSSFPGANPQEGAGRLINCYAEPLGSGGKGGIAPNVWRRAPGLTLFGRSSHSGYRGGMIANNVGYNAWNNVAATVDGSGNITDIGSFPGNSPISIAHNQVEPTPDVVAVDPNVGAYILNTQALTNGSATATVAGTVFTAGDTVSLTFINDPLILAETATYTLIGGGSPTTVATGLKNTINADATLQAQNITATSTGAVVTITQPSALANQTFIVSATTGTGNVSITFAPTSGYLGGGGGTPGIAWTGVPLPYNGVGAMPQPNSVCFQDGYFFFSVGAGQVYATSLNSLAMNPLTFVTIQSRSDVTLLRVIAYSGLLFCFTTASLEIWQDAGNPPPGFPYSRYAVFDNGLIQPSAIAGFETGFAQLMWVAQDFGVYYMPPSTNAPPQKVSTPDLERLIKAQVGAGATLEAGCYYFAGKKFWTLASPAWTWEFNIVTQQWNERWSLLPTGIYGRWRARFGHPGFGDNFIMGDVQSGNLLIVDDQNYSEIGVPQLFRIESGPVAGFPASLRVARADFLFDMGVGQVTQQYAMKVTGASLGTGGVVRLAVTDTSQAHSGDTVIVSGVGGTVEANGTWTMGLIDAMHIELIGSVYANAYTSGGTAVDVTSTPQQVDPVCAVSWSLDGGLNWGNPLIRSLGQQGRAKRPRVSVKNCGLSSPLGMRYRLDVTDPVYTGFLMGTQSADPREVGP